MTYPKDFVAIPTAMPRGEPKSYLVAPIYHDGSSQEDLLSGEVLISMRALTPFLPANDEMSISDCQEIQAIENKGLCPPKSWNLVGSDGKRYALDPTKKLIEPLRLGKGDGRVLVPGARFKGLVGQSLGALFAAPFSRVAERTYSIRPNAAFPDTKKKLRREPRPAIVQGVMPDGSLKINVLPFSALSSIIFVRKGADACIDTEAGARQATSVDGVKLEENEKTRRKHLVADRLCSTDLSGYCHFPYFGGVDGEGYMFRLFVKQMKKGTANVYHHVLVPSSALPGKVVAVPPSVLAHHARTLGHLKNRKEGHLRREHPLTHGSTGSEFHDSLPNIEEGIDSAGAAIRTPNQLIYVEVELDENGTITGINSIGASYYYLWLCLNSIRKVWTGRELVDRPITVPRPEEWPEDKHADHSPPAQLTVARALLGYVADDRNPGMAGIGKGDFEQMAGRFGFNNALEVLRDGENGDADDRFLMADHGCIVPLRVLGAPRPSAVGHYIQQPTSGPRKGYGESPHEPGGELGGYVFYLHQPDAAQDPLVYSFRRDDEENVKSDQSSLARYVSCPGREFRVRLRFTDLRRWELAALLVCLRPGLLAAPEVHPFVADPDETSPKHAVKLGRGRPLGLGSLDMSIDRVVTREDVEIPEDALRNELKGLRRMMADSGLEKPMNDWLAVHQYNGQLRAAYPTRTNTRGETTIVAHYADETQKFLRARRVW